MSTRERAGLISRIRQIRSVSGPEQAPAEGDVSPNSPRIQALEARVTHLEELIEGLQDSVYREAQRESKRLAELEARMEPAAIAALLSKDARERGL